MDDVRRWAAISEDGRYRYALHRRWDDPEQPASCVCWVMLNPSTADADRDDATLHRITRYSSRWGHGRLSVVNLYAWRATHPRDLPRDPAERTGPDNVAWCTSELAQADTVVVAWGAGATAPAWLLELLRARPDQPLCLGVTKTGQPVHPLIRQPAPPRAVPWPLPA